MSTPDELRELVESYLAELIAAHGGVVRRLAVVGDVAQQMALGVLRPGPAEVHPDAPVDRRRPFLAVAIDGHAANEHDAPSVDEVAGDAAELRAERGEGERVAGDVEHIVDEIGRASCRERVFGYV